MRTIGNIFKETRLKKRISLLDIEEETKIKKEFIEAIENENWQGLPDFTIVSGFVKSLAQYLDIDVNKSVAFLKRDYPPKKENFVNPKPDISQKFFWSPKLTFWLGFGIVFILIFAYLGFQYKRFVSPPRLEIYSPKEAEVVRTNLVKVTGKTDTDAVVKVNNQLVLTDSEGGFETEIQIIKETSQIVVKARSRSGKETILSRNIKPEF